MGRLQEYSIVVTGAGRGLGAAAARRFAEEGARVVVSDMDEAAAIASARSIDPSGRRAIGVRCDISCPEDCEQLITAAEVFFDGPVDVFLAHAGVGFLGRITEVEVEQIRRTVDVNITGTIFSARAALRSLVKSPRACLLLTSSLQGFLGRPLRSVYTASKHAIVGLTKGLALEFGPQGVRVNAIAPAATDTPHWRNMLAQTTDDVDAAVRDAAASMPLGHLPTPKDFAETAVFLASPAASSITGHTLLIDCGAAAGLFTGESRQAKAPAK